MRRNFQQNKDATIYVGDISDHVTEDILYELFMQAGPVASVNIPRDRITNRHNGYGFVEFRTEDDARYASDLMNGVKLYGSPIKISTNTSGNKDNLDVAKLYIGNLSEYVTDTQLNSLFAHFGNLQTCRVVIDPSTGKSRGHGFVSYDTFEAADAAIAKMNGQFVCNQPITVGYAYKNESRSGERHGDKAERLVTPAVAASAALRLLKSQMDT